MIYNYSSKLKLQTIIMFIIFSNNLSSCLILFSVFLVSEVISFPEVSEEDEPYREYTHAPSKLKYDYGNVSTKLVVFDTGKIFLQYFRSRTVYGNS